MRFWAFVGRGMCVTALMAMLFAAAPPARAEAVVHVVQPGETLFRIGLRYGVSWVEIQRVNHLPGTLIYPGQQLIIPGAEAEATPAPPVEATPVPEAAPAPESSATYVVQRGDTLFSIALRFGVTLAELIAANNLFNPSLIYAGQTLVIPGAAASAEPAPPPASPGGAKSILIDISEQHLYAYEGESLMFSFVASTGSPGLDTRPGTYAVQNKIPNAYGGNWNIWMPNWLGIYWAGNLQNGIHALPILPDGSRLWDGYLGAPVSYGCIILGVEESQLLYDWAEVGTPVIIHY
jgi:LysM repeat protein